MEERKQQIPNEQHRAGKFTGHIFVDAVLIASIEWIRDNVQPDEVFDKSSLDRWAIKNGYIHSDRIEEGMICGFIGGEE